MGAIIKKMPVGPRLADGRLGTLYVRDDGDYEVAADGVIEPYDRQVGARIHLETLIASSGLTREKFAEQMARDERTLRRWTAGKVPVPQIIVRWLFKLSSAAAAGRDLQQVETLDQMLGLLPAQRSRMGDRG